MSRENNHVDRHEPIEWCMSLSRSSIDPDRSWEGSESTLRMLALSELQRPKDGCPRSPGRIASVIKPRLRLRMATNPPIDHRAVHKSHPPFLRRFLLTHVEFAPTAFQCTSVGLMNAKCGTWSTKPSTNAQNAWSGRPRLGLCTPIDVLLQIFSDPD
jgi:hypothetical protein